MDLKAQLTSYLYNGTHRYFQRTTRTFDHTRLHYDWKYKIILNGLTVYTRSGFCTHAAAVKSLRRNWPKVTASLTLSR